MKVFRSILAIVVGWMVSGVVILGFQMANFFMYAPQGDKPALAMLKELSENPEAMKTWIHSVPPTALLTVLVSWQVGAFVAGGVAALIAGRARLVHAGIIGVLVLLGTIINFLDMKARYDFSHPDWMIIAGLLLPIPMSLAAGKLVAWIFPPPTSPAPVFPS